MPDDDPWSSISHATQPGMLSSRRVDASHPQDLYWARDEAGTRALVLKGELHLEKVDAPPKIRGIAFEYGPTMLKLALQDNSILDVFQTLCEDLVEFVRPVQDATRAAEAIFVRLLQWQRLLDRGREGRLKEIEIRGLYAELRFLSAELLPKFGPESIGLWTGPEGTAQDFQFGTGSIEVKSRSSSSTPSVTISSAEQLWSPFSILYLCVYTLGQVPSASGGMSLKALIESIRKCLGYGLQRDKFEEKLLDAGYIDLPDYGQTDYSISDPMIFEVRGGFPRILPTQVADGISAVSYRLHLEKCLPFSSDIAWDDLAQRDNDVFE